MSHLHIFASTGRFPNLGDLRAYIDPTYTEDGDAVPSLFMKEVGLRGYEPACLEALCSNRELPLSVLLGEASYSDQWIGSVRTNVLANAAICVFEPNRVEHPEKSSLLYVGTFEYQKVLSESFRRTFSDKK